MSSTIERPAHSSAQASSGDTLDAAAEVSERITRAALGTIDVALLYIGERLGLYRAIARAGSVTSGELASATATAERYCREWLEANAATGLIAVQDATASPTERRFALRAGTEAALVDEDDAGYLGFVPRLFVGCLAAMPALLDAFATGGGVSWSDFGPDVIEGQESQNRVLFLSELGRSWLPSIPDVDLRLRRPGARVADVACGTGWSSIAIALAYPDAIVHGFDLDEYSIDRARRNASRHGVADRVRFEVRDAADPALAGSYDLVTIFEALHDMGRPADALAAARSLAGEDGAVIVMDEKAEESFTPDASELERLFYGFSVLCCLPSALADGPVGTGTLLRPDTLAEYARQAGFRDVEVLTIETDMFRFYRLR